MQQTKTMRSCRLMRGKVVNNTNDPNIRTLTTS